jgi:transposase
MSSERLAMRKIREVLRLKYSCQIKSVRSIASSAGCSKTSVSEYLGMAEAAGIISWADVEPLAEEELEKLFYPASRNPVGGNFSNRSKELQDTLPGWSEIHEQLRDPNVTLALLWAEYRVEHPTGYHYTQFSEYYRRWKGKLAVVMRQSHRPGEKAFIDYCDGLFLTNRTTGEITKTQLFVGAMGASCYTFAIASMSQAIPDWTWCNRKFFEFLGGVMPILVPDNLKSGIKKSCRYEPTLNPAYQELAEHYGTCVIPARVRKPRDKAKAENGVLQAQRWILAVLRKRVFYSLAEMNASIAECLIRLNTKLMRGYGKSRQEMFDLLDKPVLKKLPATPYEWGDWVKFKLGIDYHLRYDEHFYSGPYQLAKEELWLGASGQMISVYFKGRRVASHVRSYKKWDKTTLSEHMPSHHRAYAEWTPERILNWVKTIGPGSVQLVEKMMAEKQHPEQAFKSALGIISLSKKYGSERVEKASLKALKIKSHSYHTLKTMLKNNMEDVDMIPKRSNVSSELNEQLGLVAKENLRGQGYYH